MSISDIRQCPMCGKDLLATAEKCRHCGAHLNRTPPPKNLLAESDPSETPINHVGDNEKHKSDALLAKGYRAIEEEGRDGELWKEIMHIKSGILLRLIPAGEFDMGSPDSEQERWEDEGPVHRVKISKAFYIGKYEVTQKEWLTVMHSNPSCFKGDNLPVDRVSQTGAKEFCDKAGGGLRLATNAEWEYACRAGTKTPFNTGDNITTDQANYDGNYPYPGNPRGKYRQTTTPVGSFKPNAWGLYDMHGNLWEWCEDYYEKKYYGECKNGVTDPTGPRNGSSCVMRGGSWSSVGSILRSAYRAWIAPGVATNFIGFRVALSTQD